MRPVPIPGPGVLVPADVAAAIAPALTRALSEAQRLGSYVHPDTAETIERIDMLGNAWLKRNPNVPKVPFLDIDRSDDFESITVQQAAAQLGVSDTAVKARLRNESLRSVKRGGRWRVDAEAVRREAVCR